jgi:hypothetical protein
MQGAMTIEKQLRIPQVYTSELTIGFLALVSSAFQNKRQRIDDLDVERLNTVEPDGKLRMAITNKESVPDPVLNGKTYAGARNDTNRQSARRGAGAEADPIRAAGAHPQPAHTRPPGAVAKAAQRIQVADWLAGENACPTATAWRRS